jgi:hypothetical protein
MSKEQRAVFIGILITLVYALTMWIEKGVFLYPFPLNEFIFFVVAALFIRLNYSKNSTISLIAGITALFYLLSSPFFWGFFFDEIKLDIFLEAGIYDLLKFLHSTSVIFWMIFTLNGIQGKKRYLYYAILAPVFVLSLFVLPQELGLLGILSAAIISLIYGLKKPFDSLWVLFSYLSLMKFLVFFFS